MERNKAEKAYELAFKYEAEYGGCAQTTLATIFDALNVNDYGAEIVFKSATGLGGGIGVLGDGTCGAVAAMVMSIGYFFGREISNFADPEKKRFETYKLAREFYLAFKNKIGATRCHDIQKRLLGRIFDLLDSKDWEEFLRLGGHTDKCPFVTGTAAKLAVEMILENLR